MSEPLKGKGELWGGGTLFPPSNPIHPDDVDVEVPEIKYERGFLERDLRHAKQNLVRLESAVEKEKDTIQELERLIREAEAGDGSE